MTKASTKILQKQTGWVKSVVTKVLASALLLELLVVPTLFFYAACVKAVVEVEFDGLVPNIKVSPQINAPPTILANPVEQPVVDKRPMVDISRFPPELQGTPDQVVDKVIACWREHQAQCESVWYCCCTISTEIALKARIDTNEDTTAASTRQVYKCVQICLNVAGSYNGRIDGDPERTRSAVTEFQRRNGINVDGKVGKETWSILWKLLSQKIQGGIPLATKYLAQETHH